MAGRLPPAPDRRKQRREGKVMPKYGEKSKMVVKEAMHKMKKGRLKSGRSGKTVRNPKQAIAIGLSESRKKGVKVAPPPKKRPRSSSRKG